MGLESLHQRRDVKIVSQIQACLEPSKSRTWKPFFDSASKSNQAGNVKIVYCEGAGLAANNQAQLEGIIGGAQISTNEGLAYIIV